MWNHKERQWVCMYVEGEQLHIHTSSYDITLGFCMFVFSEYCCQDNHGGCIGYCGEIQLFPSFLENVASGQRDVWCTFATHMCLKRNRTAEISLKCFCLPVSSQKWVVHFQLSPCRLSNVTRDCVVFPLHHWFRLRRCQAHLPGNSCIISKKIHATHSVFYLYRRQRNKQRDSQGVKEMFCLNTADIVM